MSIKDLVLNFFSCVEACLFTFETTSVVFFCFFKTKPCVNLFVRYLQIIIYGTKMVTHKPLSVTFQGI